MNSTGWRFFVLSASFALAAPAAAQSTKVFLRTGDGGPDGNSVLGFEGVFADDRGSWLGIVHTDGPDWRKDQFLLRDGAVLLGESDALQSSEGAARLHRFDSICHDDAGNLAAILQFVGPTSGAIMGGLYWNDRQLAESRLPAGGSILTAPEVPPGTTWRKLTALKVNDARTLLVLGEIENPAVDGRGEDALVRLRLDGSGNVLSTNVLLTEAQYVPALTDTVAALGRSGQAIALNARGDFLALVEKTFGDAAYMINLDTVLARDGADSIQ